MGEMHRSLSMLWLTAWLWAGCGPEDDGPLGMPPPNPAGTSCAMSFDHIWSGGATTGGYSAQSEQSLEELHLLGIRAVTFMPTGWMETLRSVKIEDHPDRFLDTHVAQMRKDARKAKQLGMKLMIKPHILVGSGKWVANANPDQDRGGWAAWFASYETFIGFWARFAEQVGADYFCAGTELRRSALEQPQRWRAMLTRIRKSFSGRWTYTAHFDSPEKVTFWNHLDLVGVAMFGPLADHSYPTPAELKDSAEVWLDRYERLARKYQLPLMLTEVGFSNRARTAMEPWKWPSRLPAPEHSALGDLQQRQAYEAIISTFGHSPEVEALFWWKWFDDAAYQETREGVGFSPRGKPALEALRAECATGRAP